MALKRARSYMGPSVMEDSPDAVSLICEKEKLVNERGHLGMTPLHWAALYGHHEVVEVLLANGANPRIKDKEERTAEDLAWWPPIKEKLRNPGNLR